VRYSTVQYSTVQYSTVCQGTGVPGLGAQDCPAGGDPNDGRIFRRVDGNAGRGRLLSPDRRNEGR